MLTSPICPYPCVLPAVTVSSLAHLAGLPVPIRFNRAGSGAHAPTSALRRRESRASRYSTHFPLQSKSTRARAPLPGVIPSAARDLLFLRSLVISPPP